MKKIKFQLNGILFGYRKPSALLDGLNKRTIAVFYPKTLVLGVLREEQIKVWNVAVKTVEPDISFNSHAAWMVGIQTTRASLISIIASYEWNEVCANISYYSKGVVIKPILMEKVNN